MKKISVIITLFLITTLLFATGQKENGGLLTISGTNVGSIQIADTTITTIKAGNTATSTNLDWVYANVADLNLSVKWFTDLAIALRSEYTQSRLWRSVYTDIPAIFTDISWHDKALYKAIGDIPPREYGGRYFDGLWLSTDYTSGTMLFDKELNLVLNKRIKYIYELNSTTSTNTTYTTFTVVQYSDDTGWCFDGGYLTLYAKWSYPEPKEETTVIIHWGDMAQGIDLTKAIEVTTVHKGDTGLNVTIPVTHAKIFDYKENRWKAYKLLGVTHQTFPSNREQDYVCRGIDNISFNQFSGGYTTYDEQLEHYVWSCDKEFVNLYAVWGTV